MPDTILLVAMVISAIALFFDYVNGFHDAANSIATVVTTRVLTSGQAVIWAAFSISSPRSPSARRSQRPLAAA